ncbi:dipeptidase [Xanthovirga aplysinae]|uniref:dipeptidase n=1 Tax=Xanthovirga aplysinae TaxID=2529853 RepID=UPI0012BC1092|nr:dipeptidase [Xanthovirga aplysinae]MTI31939.1 membrane dipeptidase [Xanthovirga aplysinae]
MKRQLNVLLLFSGIIFGVGCQPKETSNDTDKELKSLANKLAQEYIIVDGHVDIPYRLKNKWEDISVRTENGDFDYIRAKEGGLNAPFMSIYTPSSLEAEIGSFDGSSKALADTLIDMVYQIAETHPDKFTIATSPDEIEEIFAKGKIALPMGMENGSPIEGKLENIQYFYDRGVRYITLTHGKNNHIGDSSYDTTRYWNGLSEFGRQVVQEMNRVGILVDISHVSDSTFYQVMEISKAPVIASHTSCRHFTPDFERNMSDDMIKALGQKEGVIMINFGSTFLSGESQKMANQNREHIANWLEENQMKSDDSKAKEYIEAYIKDHPFKTDVNKAADHIDHVVKLVGIEHVGFGSDYDGVGDSLPIGLDDASFYPNLIFTLLKRGYSEEDIRKICYQNVFRVWREAEKFAKESQAIAKN